MGKFERSVGVKLTESDDGLLHCCILKQRYFASKFKNLSGLIHAELILGPRR